MVHQKVNGTKEEKNLPSIFFNWKNLNVKKNFGIKSNVKMEHINLIWILFSMNKLSFMKNYLKRKGDYLLSFVKETLDDCEKTDLEKVLNEIEIKKFCYGT